MLALTLQQAKGSFFDRESVIKAEDAASRKTLSKFGAFVRRRAQTSIRPRRDVSQPGQPPSSHVGTLRKMIFFAYDKDRRSVVIGPTLLKAGAAVLQGTMQARGYFKRMDPAVVVGFGGYPSLPSLLAKAGMQSKKKHR
jgi:hypothetical protein